MDLTIDELEDLFREKFRHGREFTHIVVFLMEIDKTIPLKVLNVLFEKGFNFLAQDDYGFSAFHYAAALVFGYFIKENIEFLSKLFDYLTYERVRKSKTPSSKRQMIFERMKDVSLNIKWSIKSSIIPFISKWMANDTIKITKKGNLVMMNFTVLKVKKFSFNRRETTVVFDFNEKPEDCLTSFGFYMIDHQTNTICNLSKKFSLEEKKQILKGLITNKLRKVKQNEGDLFKNQDFLKTNPKNSKQLV